VFLKQPVQQLISDLQEIQLAALDVKLVISQNISQTEHKPDVLLDQKLCANVMNTKLVEDTNVQIAHLDKLETQLTQLREDVLHQHVLVDTKSNLLLTKPLVVDANNAHGHNLNLMYQELNVFKDHLLFATVEKRDLPVVMNVKTAQLDSSNLPVIQNNVLDHHVLDNTKSNSQSIQLPVDCVRPANGLNSNQIMPETNVNQDQLLFAIALTEDHKTNTHV
jgi:hypothetical protein